MFMYVDLNVCVREVTPLTQHPPPPPTHTLHVAPQCSVYLQIKMFGLLTKLNKTKKKNNNLKTILNSAA